LFVKKFNGTSWVDDSSFDLSTNIDDASFAFDSNGTIHVAYIEQDHSNSKTYLSVMKYNGSWIFVGSSRFLPLNYYVNHRLNFNINLANNILYLGINNKVYEYNSSWNAIIDNISHPVIDFHPTSHNVVIAYMTDDNYLGFLEKNGSNWINFDLDPMIPDNYTNLGFNESHTLDFCWFNEEYIPCVANEPALVSSSYIVLVLKLESPVYRFWSDKKQGHFYTISMAEKNYIIASYLEDVWRYEGLAYIANDSSVINTTPIFRFWSDEKQHHFYTASESEKDYVIATYPESVWKYEGIAYYAYATSQPNTDVVYRFWSDEKQGHFYTSSEAEKNHIITTYADSVWRYEGIAWHVPNN